MGAIAGLICSPCTTAPLSAILLYIAQSGNLWLGGGTLYLYALGMGLPLILVTVFGNRLLPKSGPWMSHVKTAFGFVILALPVFLLERIIRRPVGVTAVVNARCRLLQLGVYRLRWALHGRGCGWYRSFCLPPRWSARGLCRTGRLAPRRVEHAGAPGLHPRQLGGRA